MTTGWWLLLFIISGIVYTIIEEYYINIKEYGEHFLKSFAGFLTVTLFLFIIISGFGDFSRINEENRLYRWNNVYNLVKVDCYSDGTKIYSATLKQRNSLFSKGYYSVETDQEVFLSSSNCIIEIIEVNK